MPAPGWAEVSHHTLGHARIRGKDPRPQNRSLPLSLGGKKHLRSGHQAGGRSWACIPSLIETYEINSVDPLAYLSQPAPPGPASRQVGHGRRPQTTTGYTAPRTLSPPHDLCPMICVPTICAFQRGYDAVAPIWGALPQTIGDLACQAAQGLIDGVEVMPNAVVRRINHSIGGLNSALAPLQDWAAGEGGERMALPVRPFVFPWHNNSTVGNWSAAMVFWPLGRGQTFGHGAFELAHGGAAAVCVRVNGTGPVCSGADPDVIEQVLRPAAGAGRSDLTPEQARRTRPERTGPERTGPERTRQRTARLSARRFADRP